MDLDGPYDTDNVFARILRGEIPAATIWEDEHAIAIMDAFPQTRGHCLVIPRAQARNLLDAPPDALSHVIALTRKIARAASRALECDGVRIAQFNGAAAGQTVFHLHFHVIPVWEGQAPGRHGGGQADSEELQALAQAIRAQLG